MHRDHGSRPIRTDYLLLWALTMAAIAYAVLVHAMPTMTGSIRTDGLIGVLLGLYICSHPAANFLNMVLYGGRNAPKFSSLWSALLWLAVNMLVMAAGWFAIFIGVTMLAGSVQ
jgi:hypothetical protein